MDTVSTDQIIQKLSDMDPKEAVITSGIRAEHCTLRVNHLNGTTLKSIRGKIGAAYIRVSSDEQANSGWSLDDQVRLACDHFFAKQQEFVIFNDASFSGLYPPYDPAMIDAMLINHCERYEQNFRTVLLGSYANRTPDETFALEAYLVQQLLAMRMRGNIVIVSDDVIRLARKQRGMYRPGLSLLLERLDTFNEIAISDSSRLARNYALFPELVRRFQKAEVRLVGLMESLEFTTENTKDFDGRLLSRLQLEIIAWTAEKQLRAMSIASLRGIAERLRSNKAHGKLPYFLEYGDDGQAHWKAGAKEAILRLIELVNYRDSITGKRFSYIEISNQMQNQHPLLLGHSHDWSRRRIVDMLRNPALIGKQSHFGLEIKIPTAIISEQNFQRLQERLNEIADKIAGTKRTKTANGIEISYLATGLIRCVCGQGTLYHTHPGKTYEGYFCGSAISNKNEQYAGKHTKLNFKDVDEFLNQLMRNYKGSIEPFTSKDEDAIRQATVRLKTSEDTLYSAKHQLEAAELKARLELLSEARSRGLTGSKSAEYAALLMSSKIASEQEAVDDIRQSVELHLDELAVLQRKGLKAMIRNKMDVWDELDVSERNAILLIVFNRWEVRGKDPSCRIVPILTDGTELPMIPLVTSTRVSKKDGDVQYTRRFPSWDKYLDNNIKYAIAERVVKALDSIATASATELSDTE